MRLTRTASFLAVALTIAGCFKGSSSKTTEAEKKGQLGVFYVVNVSRPVGGTITTPDGQINCGTAGNEKDACGPATYSWNVPVTLSAVPDAGKAFVSWAGDCGGTGACVLDTVSTGADKWVVAVFNSTDRLGHAAIPDPAQHGPLFFDFVKKVPAAPKCNTCHGATYTGLANAPSCESCHAAAGFPNWLENCGFCHGDPPAVPHVQLTTCSACHSGYGDNTGSGTQATNAATHMNGVVDVSGAACTTCHGTPDVNAAPPVDSQGRTATTFASVGAHQVHLVTTIAKAVACGECHTVPTDVSHATNPPASKVKFGPLANKGTTTVWDAGTATCASTYCHGGSTSLAGGLATTPLWTLVDGTQKTCTSCHGAPPTAPHPQNSDCAICHTGYTVGSVDATTHVDGVVDVRALTCSTCHGDPLRTGADPYIAAAPPLGTQGETATSQPAVGAHMAHLSAGSLARAFACTDCHNPPSSTTHASGAVEFSFSVLAGGSSVSYDPATSTCSNTYCHGNFTGGNTANRPVWTAGPAGAGCGTCHGFPPAAPHTQSSACGSCHPGYSGISVNLTSHVNGTVDVVALTCTSCHGTVNVNAAPPVDTGGASATTLVSVGAHQAHVTTTLMASPVACTECHGAASGSYGMTHTDGTVQVQFGPKANLNTVTVWNGTSATCASSYCHGGTTVVSGGTATLPTWNRVDGTQKTCASCHGAPPPAPHVQSTACGSCHTGYTSSTVAAASHVNGAVDVVLGPTSCAVCHGAPPATPDHRTAGGVTTCVSCHDQTVDASGSILTAGKHRNGAVDLSLAMNCAKCHGTVGRAPNPTSFADEVEGAPPRDLAGNTAPTTPGVGAHLVHVNGLRSKNLLCSDCHDVSSVMTGLYSHANGTVEMAWGTLATLGGVTPTYVLGSGSSCNATYCHGNFTGGNGVGASPAWTTAGTLGCTACHGAPPPLSATIHHPGNTSCGTCHGTGYASTTVAQATHVDGTVTLSRSGCTLCHGDLTQTGVASGLPATAPGFNAASADTRGNTLPTAAAVGAHAAHVNGTRWRATALSCSECHAVPADGDVSHATGTGTGGARATLTFGALATTGGITTAGYAGSLTGAGGATAGTCSNTYCHGNFKNGSAANVPAWLGGATAASCGSCHGLPPGGTHPASSSCGTCHTGYAIGAVNAATHLNGSVDVSSMSCTSCHGDAARASVAGADLNQASAPPLDTAGATTGVRVGKHGSHVNPAAAGAVFKPVGCTECHPDNSANGAHSNGVVNVTFAAATGANLGSFSPTFVQGDGTATQTTCATYCHGSSLDATTTRGSVASWTWDGAAADCGSCHKSPPGTANHHAAAALTTCRKCHGGTVDGAGVVNVAGGLHVNGAVDTVNLTCTTCHGNGTLVASGLQDPNVAAAPTGTGAPDTYGRTAVTDAGVGVHAAHVLGTRSRPVQCNACHTVPGTTVHKTGVATSGTVALANLATTGGVANATYAGAGGTCSNVYCHGNFAGGVGATATAAWTTTGTLGCTSCHGAPPALSAATHHPANADCATCHGTGYSSSTVVAASHVDGAVTLSRSGCTLCHGDLTQTAVAATSAAAAPGFNAASADTTGSTLATSAAVGAHAAHLTGTTWRATPLACSECHVAPADGDVSHATGAGPGGARATVTFSGLATTGAITTAAYAGSTTGTGANGAGTCSNTYCHGNFKNGAAANAPSWLGGAAASACGSCHGLPPGGTHPASAACESCHTGYTGTSVNATAHLNGSVDVVGLSCTSCHGDAARLSVAGADLNQASAPPVDSHGATVGVLVGTHLSHVNPAAAGSVYKPVACTECHVENAGNISHSNNAVNVTFAAATGANLGSYAPTFVQGNGVDTQTTCATYCHGSSLNATTTRGSVASWTWNGAAADCGSCHKSPPGTANHHNAATLSTCATCHGGTVNGTGIVNVAGGLHVNGAIDTSTLTCTTCHGNGTLVASGLQDPNVAAAPTGTGAPDTYGNTAIATANGVGVHAAHVLGTRSRPVLCNACHTVPGTTIHKTGVSTSGTVALANLATTGGIANATYAGSGGTCSNVYCHGNLGGGIGASNVTPSWKTAATLVCNSCHGTPPAATSTGRFHPNRSDCGACHTGYSSTTVSATNHVNGIVDYVAQTCTTCHGDSTRTGLDAGGIAFSSAPPADSTGLLTGGTKIGAHEKHLLTGAAGGPTWSKQVACGECHSAAIPVNPLHANGQPNVAFGTLAATGTGTPAVPGVPSYAGATCSNTYCHGNFKNGAGANALDWTTGTAACGSCHGTPPGGTHPAGSTLATCGNCHGNYSNATQSIVNPAGHVDGSVDLSNMSCTSCHGTGGRVSVAGADLNQASAPPLDTLGAATGARVGTHGSHVNPVLAGSVYKPVACTECHPNNTTNDHANAAREVNFDLSTGAKLTGYAAGAVLGDGTTQTTCATYCHGATLDVTTTRGSVASWTWNGAAADCGSCHKSPPGTANHHDAAALTTCSKCHGGTVSATGVVNVAGGLHVNGTINTANLTCTTCHGDATLVASGLQDPNVSSAPTGTGAPDTYGRTAVTDAGVGVHAAHVLGTRSRPVLCNACHTVPGTTIHKTGVATAGTVALANLATTGGIATATYAGSGGTCSNVYCHGNFAGGVGATATASWTSGGTLACTSCHGAPPALSAASHHPGNTACATCHGMGYTGSTVVAATHVDGATTLSRSGCTLCHGDLTQTAVAATSAAAAPGFNASAADTTGATAATSAAVGAHAKHLTGTRWRATALACSECHTVPAAGDVAHATGTGSGGARATLAFGTLARTGGITTAAYAGSTTASGANGAGTCSNVYCHGNFTNGTTANAPSWLGGTAAAACGSCHGTPPGGTHPASSACETCHTGYTITSINPANHLNGSVQVDALTCTSCHGQGSRVSVAGADVNQASAPPLDSLGAATGVRVGVHEAHVNPAAAGAVFRPIACVDCHPNNAGNNTHSNGTREVVLTGSVTANLGGLTAARTLGDGSSTATTCSTYCHGATMGVGFTGSVGTTWSWTGSAAACGSCHGFPPTVSHSGVTSTASACNACHPGTVKADGSIDVAGGLHINGQLDGGGEPVAGGTNCGGCHAAYFDAMNGTIAKVSRHAMGSDVPLDGNFNWTGATLGASVAPGDRTCISMCHGDHPHTLTSPATTTHDNNAYVDATTQASRAADSATRVGAGGSGTQNRARTDFDPTGNTGLCASCHQRPIVANGITVSAATFGASAHDFTSNTVAGGATYGWSYGLHDGSSFGRNCTKCHASRAEGTTPASTTTVTVHYSDTDPNLLAGTTNPAGNAANFACYNCHGSVATPGAGVQGNRSGKDIQAQVVHATTAGQSGHPSNADTRHDTVAEFAAATFGNSLGVTAGAGQRHASCMDCHDPHEAKATSGGTRVTGSATNGNVAGPALQGAWGARLSANPAFWTTPTSASFTKQTIAAGTDLEATLCFKCHTGYYWGTGTPPTAPSGAFAETDQAKEFNPGNVGNFATTGTTSWQSLETAGSFHPVLASAGNNLGATSNITGPWSRASLMTCTDCHESNTTTDPQGPHGSASQFILKGPNTTWSSSVTATGQNAFMETGTFCLNCHANSTTNSRFPGHSRGDHAIACMNCHAAIPHGAPRPGLLNAAAGVATTGTTRVPAMVAGYDGVYPYWQGGTTDRLFLKSYPTSNTASWSQSNCGCNGSGH